MRDGGLAARLDEWRIVLARQAVLARQMQKQAVHRLRLTREVRDEGRFYGSTGQAPYGRLLAGLIRVQAMVPV